jgi:hypothetical protein
MRGETGVRRPPKTQDVVGAHLAFVPAVNLSCLSGVRVSSSGVGVSGNHRGQLSANRTGRDGRMRAHEPRTPRKLRESSFDEHLDASSLSFALGVLGRRHLDLVKYNSQRQQGCLPPFPGLDIPPRRRLDSTLLRLAIVTGWPRPVCLTPDRNLAALPTPQKTDLSAGRAQGTFLLSSSDTPEIG